MNLTTRSVIVLALISTFGAFSASADDVAVVAASKVKFNGLAQFWSINDTTSSVDKFNFRLRRAELKFSGSVTENTRWFVMLDAAKAVGGTSTDVKPIQDLGVAWNLTPELEIVGGQFKILTTAEGLDASAELLFPERSAVARAYGDIRDQGVQVNYKTDKFKIGAMVSNGINTTAAANTKPSPGLDDVNSDKDLSIRLDVFPVDHLKLGAFTYANEMKYWAHGRNGANVRWDADGLLVRFEGVLAGDYGVKSKGWNLDGGYTLNDTIQPVVRWEGVTTENLATGQAFWLGVNYLMAKNGAKIQLAGASLHNLSSASSTGSSTGTYTLANKNGAMIMLAFQAAI